MSKLSKVMSLLTGGTPKMPEIPAPKVPAPPAPTRRVDTGASVKVGVDSVKNQRVSGSGVKPRSSATVDILAGLGRGSGLRV